MCAKRSTAFFCSNCGHQESKWLGRCPACGEWNTLDEKPLASATAGNPSGQSARATGTRNRASATPIASVETETVARVSTGIGELDRVLGGGLVSGATVLVGGEPGIGKSTLMLQMAAQIRSMRVLYVSGEETVRQLKLRADRIGLSNEQLHVMAENNLDHVVSTTRPKKAGDRAPYDVVIVDSIQTLASSEAGAVPGTPNQIKYCTFELAESAREYGMAVFFVAHVTKEGSIAGPRTMEHMVDTVLYFEQSDDDTRYLRAAKNRFGSTDEIGLFTMQQQGLVQITDPNGVFLVQRSGSLPPGVVVAPVIEGSRVLLVEVQALTVPAKGGISRVFSDKVDSRRVSRVSAVLEKHVGLGFSDYDIYVNVAGGVRIRDVGVELPLALALYSARTDRPFPSRTAAAGELSLAGEIRPVPHMARRARTAGEVGFERTVGPVALRQGEAAANVSWSTAATIAEAVDSLF